MGSFDPHADLGQHASEHGAMDVVTPVRWIVGSRAERDIEVAAVAVRETHLFGRRPKLLDGVEPFTDALRMQEPVTAPFCELASVEFVAFLACGVPQM